jgi:hypothetical protein
MAFPAVTNVDGSNPGPQSATLPDTVQTPVGNIWKIGAFALTLAPATVGTATIAEQTFAMTGLLTTDIVYTSMQSPVATCGILNSRCSAAGVLAIEFICYSNTTSGASASLAGTYNVLVTRVQPNWTAPASGALMDW